MINPKNNSEYTQNQKQPYLRNQDQAPHSTKPRQTSVPAMRPTYFDSVLHETLNSRCFSILFSGPAAAIA